MHDLLGVVPAPVDHGPSQRIECGDLWHNGPIDDSPRSLKNAAEHDPGAPAAFLWICPACGSQTPLCEKKVDVLLEWALIGSGYARPLCGARVRIDKSQFLPLIQG